MTERARLWTAWTGILLAPLIWAICLPWNNATVGGICGAGHGRWRLHVVWIIALLISATGWLSAFRTWNAAGRGAPPDEVTPAALYRFLGVFGMLFTGLVIVLIVAQWIPVFLVDPCAH